MKISPRKFSILLAFCFQLSVGFVRSQCLEDQRSSLIQFKGNLTFDPILSWGLVTWNSSIDCCLWEGVTCNDGGHVIGLDLNYESISGGIDNSSSLFDLHHIQSLDLSGNNFSGPIPSFSSAKNLIKLRLGSNHFSGSIITTNWSDLSKLEFIDLSKNSLHGVIPASLFGIPSLRSIRLSLNQFTETFNELSKLASSILDLDLSYNKLRGPFPMFVSQLRSLEHLQLSFNNFSGQVNLSSLQQLKNLLVFDLSYNNLSIYDTGVDPASFPQIRVLRLAACNLTRIPAFLKEKSHMSYLDLSNNKIGGDVPDWIWTPSLFSLNLSHNSLLNFQEFSEGFNHSMFSLDLSNNKLQGELLTKIPYVSYALYLSNNNIQGSIPQSICNSTDLNLLDLSNNSLNGSIPQCLFGMVYLRVLNLRGNNLSDNISDTFSDNCGSLRTF